MSALFVLLGLFGVVWVGVNIFWYLAHKDDDNDPRA